jgi:RimJ/RimL family protein N-acetyltransferase
MSKLWSFAAWRATDLAMADDLPTLRTPRLVLRAHRLEDFPSVAAMWSDPDFVRFIGAGQPLSPEAAWAKLQRTVGAWPLLGYGFWAIEQASSGRVIGEAGFLEARAPTGQVRTPETGWALETSARGQGYAGEAVAAVLAWGDERFERTTCDIARENVRSIALARRHGYHDIGPAPLPEGWTGPDFIEFERRGRRVW